MNFSLTSLFYIGVFLDRHSNDRILIPIVIY
jgi:hypothetical protein